MALDDEKMYPLDSEISPVENLNPSEIDEYSELKVLKYSP